MTTDSLVQNLCDTIDATLPSGNANAPLRMGAECKFSFIRTDGRAVDESTVDALWRWLAEHGWSLVIENGRDGRRVTGATKPGQLNNTVASCETGFCKVEFSLAHVATVFEFADQLETLREELRPFTESHNVRFLAYGIQPVTPPSKELLVKKTRSGVWDRVFGANRILDPAYGDDVCLFTVNAAQHVHVGLPRERIAQAVNVVNGFAGAQLALTAHSPVWRGAVDPSLKCVSEMFWDWWIPDADRVGIPPLPFRDLRHYIETVMSLRPVYVKREGRAVLINGYDSFLDYYRAKQARGRDECDREVSITPEKGDIDLHNSCYWFTARLSRYGTVENRCCDEQPPGDMTAVPALTLGLMNNLDEAWEEVRGHDWNELRRARIAACRYGLQPDNDSPLCTELAGTMLELAERGLKRRNCGEEQLLSPLRNRLTTGRCPADDVIDTFTAQGIAGLVASRSFCHSPTKS